MKITFVNGIGEGARWEPHRKSARKLETLLSAEHQVDSFHIARMKMACCLGCWDCWTRTPGLCRLKDEGVDYLKSLVGTDLLLYVSPVSAGFLSSETKKALDRFIPEALPFIELYKGECHHKKRYNHAKAVGFVLLDQNDIDPEAREIIYETIDRNSLNMQPERMLKLNLTAENTDEVYHEICGI